MYNVKKLGAAQTGILMALYRLGEWYEGCGWTWSNRSYTVDRLESLRKRGLVKKVKRKALGDKAVIAVYVPVEPENIIRII
jgi:hypothetical protein